MAIKNTTENYGSVAKWFHWATALLFLAAYCAVYYRQWFTEKDTPENWTALQLHLSVGVTIGVVVVLRIIWRVMNRNPDPAPGTRFEHLAARSGHYTLCLVMIAMPISGYIGTGVHTEYFFLFDVPKFEDTALFQWLVTDRLWLTFEEFEKPIDFFHKDIMGAWVVWLLILGHTLAALYHHFVRKDRTLRKMTTGRP